MSADNTDRADGGAGVTFTYGGADRGIAFDAGAGQLARWIDDGNYGACTGVLFCLVRPSDRYRYLPDDDRPSRWLGFTGGADTTAGIVRDERILLHVPFDVTGRHEIEHGFATIPYARTEMPEWLEHRDLGAVSTIETTCKATHCPLRIRSAPAVPTDLAIEVRDLASTLRLTWELADDDYVYQVVQTRVVTPGQEKPMVWEDVEENRRLAPGVRAYDIAPPATAIGGTIEYRIQVRYDSQVKLESEAIVFDSAGNTTRAQLRPQFDAAEQGREYGPFDIGVEVEQALPRAVDGAQTPLTYRAHGLEAVGLRFDSTGHRLTGTAVAGVAHATLIVEDAEGDVGYLGFRVTVGAPPSEPTALTATGGAGHISLTWRLPPQSDSGPILGHRLEHSADGSAGSWTVLVADTGSAACAYVHEGLGADVTRHYRVAAIDVVGRGAYSDSASGTTAAVTKASAPLGLTATAHRDEVRLDWEPPRFDGGAGVDDYVVEFSETGTDGWAEFRNSRTSATAVTHAVADGLPRSTTVYYRVAAVSQHRGSGDWSAAVSVQTYAANVPNAPLAPTAIAGTGQVSLEWTPPADDGGFPVTAYRVASSPTGVPGSWTPWLSDVFGTRAAHAPVATGERVYLRVAARNANGLGPYSAAVSARTALGAPSVPMRLTATAGRQGVLLSWQAPVDAAHLGVDGYRIDRQAPGASDWLVGWLHHSGTTRTWFLDRSSDLSATDPVKYRVAAMSPTGMSPYSAVVTANLDPNRPDPPGNVRIAPVAAGVEVSWDHPAEAGAGATVAGYRVERRRYRDTVWNALGVASGVTTTNDTATQFLDREAVDGDVIIYRVLTVNSNASRVSLPAMSEEIVVTLPVPRAPVSLQVTPEVLRNQLTWAAVPLAEVPDLAGYRIEHAPTHDSSRWQLLAEVTGSTTEAYTHDLPGNRVATYYRVAARTAESRGAYSLPVRVESVDVEAIVDVNQSGGFDSNDVLILYYAYELPELVGDGSAGSGIPSLRDELLSGLVVSGSPVDTVDKLVTAALQLAADYGDTAIDLNASGALDGDDALIMYYVREFTSLLGTGAAAAEGTEGFRRTFLGPLAGIPAPSDAELQELLRAANALSGN